MFIPLCFINRVSDIMAHIFIIEINHSVALYALARASFKLVPVAGHAQHAAAVCHHAALLIEFAACMEDIVAVPVF